MRYYGCDCCWCCALYDWSESLCIINKSRVVGIGIVGIAIVGIVIFRASAFTMLIHFLLTTLSLFKLMPVQTQEAKSYSKLNSFFFFFM